MAVQVVAEIQYLTGTLSVAFGVVLALSAVGIVPHFE
jgi:hypothetical protein